VRRYPADERRQTIERDESTGADAEQRLPHRVGRYTPLCTGSGGNPLKLSNKLRRELCQHIHDRRVELFRQEAAVLIAAIIAFVQGGRFSLDFM
jgi:hypothetical protein